jgi:uncharacterized protein (TIGR02466 family)
MTMKESGQLYQSNHDLNKFSEMKNPIAIFEKILNQEVKTSIFKEKTSGKFKIKNIWFSIQKENEGHPSHNHPKSILSGVYYLNSDAETGIIFQDPRPAADVLVPRKKTKTNENSNLLSYISKTNRLIIFPSWLLHWVPINESNRNRISISFNVQIKGQVGEHHEYQSGQF